MVPGTPLTIASDRPAASGLESTSSGRGEAIAGALLFGWFLVAAVAVHVHPGANALDRWGFEVFRRSPDSVVYIRSTDLGWSWVLAAGCLAAALTTVRRDRLRAAACLGGPFLAAVLVEFVFKPLVGRRFEAVLSYPSGNVADLAAMATAWVIAVPRWLRLPVAFVGLAAVSMMAVAVVGLRWHYPSDALAGAVLGVGTVLLVDGVAHVWAGAHARKGPRLHQK